MRQIFPWELYKRVCKSVEKNSFYHRVHLFTMAATELKDKFRLRVPKGNKGGTRVIPFDNKHTGHIKVKGFLIDMLNLPTRRLVVLKVDVEV